MKNLLFLFLSLSILLSCTNQKPVNKYDLSISQHKLKVQINQAKHLVSVEDHFIFQSAKAGVSLSFLIHKNAQLQQVEFAGQKVDYQLNEQFAPRTFGAKLIENLEDEEDYKNAAELKINLPAPVKTGEIFLKYTLTATDSVEKAAFSHEYLAYQVNGFVGEKGVFLSPSYYWYAEAPGSQPQFDLDVTIPENLYIVTQGKLIGDSVSDGLRQIIWKVEYPTDGIHLVGSHYEIQQAKYKDIDIYTYFFPETQELAPSYLQACQRYLAMYEKMIGPYPFSKFAVVENFFPTGYGMPSYTLLGSTIIRLPFIIYTSLGHEITHNWWGNSVYVDYDRGNWCEGLTTYFADYHYKEMKSPEEAMRYRRDIDRDFTVFVKEGKDFPLNQFKARTETSSRAIGYGKSAMVFHQLRRIIGDSLFYQSFKQFYRQYKFQRVSWPEIQKVVEQVSGQKLDWFFKQWIQREGAPQIRLKNIQYTEGQVSFTLEQNQPVYRLYLPVRLKIDDNISTQYFWLNKQKQIFRLPAKTKPQELAVDPEFDVFRKLDKRETVPSLAEVFAHNDAIYVLPDKCSPKQLQVYRKLAETMAQGEEKAPIKMANEITAEERQQKSFYLFGLPSENSLWNQLEVTPLKEVKISGDSILVKGKMSPGTDDLVALTFRDAKNLERNYCLITVGTGGKTGRVGSLIEHYGKYSYLVFHNGKNALKGIYSASSSPLIYKF